MSMSITGIGYSGEALGKAMAMRGYVEGNGICGQDFIQQVAASLQDLGLIGGAGSRTLEVASADRMAAVAPSSAVTLNTGRSFERA